MQNITSTTEFFLDQVKEAQWRLIL